MTTRIVPLTLAALIVTAFAGATPPTPKPVNAIPQTGTAATRPASTPENGSAVVGGPAAHGPKATAAVSATASRSGRAPTPVATPAASPPNQSGPTAKVTAPPVPTPPSSRPAPPTPRPAAPAAGAGSAPTRVAPPTAPARTAPPPPAASLRRQLPGVGLLLVSPLDTPDGTPGAEVLLQRENGQRQVLATLDGLEAVEILTGDLDGDRVDEVVVVTRNPQGSELIPYLFSGQRPPKLIHPNDDEDGAQVIGTEVSIEPLPTGGFALCVKTPLTVHDFGPPDLMACRFYRLLGGRMTKVDERIPVGSHFNQMLNAAGYAFQRGEFLEALRGYETTLASHGTTMPAEARAEAWLFIGETRKFLKDFPGALRAFEKVSQEFVECPQSEQAIREGEFIAATIGSDARALSVYIDVARLKHVEKFDEALRLLRAERSKLANSAIFDHCLYLESELLVAGGKVDEAVRVLQELIRRFPQSGLLDEAQNSIAELTSNEDEGHEDGDPGSASDPTTP